jgi:hypothetical protein
MSRLRSLRSCAALAATAALAFGAAACGGDDDGDRDRERGAATPAVTASATPTPAVTRLAGGVTTLRIDPTARRVLDLSGVGLEPIGEAAARDGRLRFPISGGTLSFKPAGGAIEHTGGVRFRARGRHVDATGLIVDPANRVVTADIRGRRVPLLVLDLQLPRAAPAAGEDVVIPGRASVFGGTLVAVLGDELGVQPLTDGLPLGDVRIAAET